MAVQAPSFAPAGAREGGGSEGGNNSIKIINAKEHNLKSFSVEIPRGQFNVITGVSGPGKPGAALFYIMEGGHPQTIALCL